MEKARYKFLIIIIIIIIIIIFSDCVIDLVSSVSLKHYMHGHFQDLVDEKN